MLAVLLVLAAVLPDAGRIMEAVAQNQQRAVDARSKYVYRQEVFLRAQQRNKKLVGEETRVYDVLPEAQGAKRVLVDRQGKLIHKGRALTWAKDGLPDPQNDLMDYEMITNMNEDLGADGKGKDGVKVEFFPLVPAKLPLYEFKLHGAERYEGRHVWKVTFQPKAKGLEAWNSPWEGELLVDQQELQPLLMTSFLSKRLPLGVRMLLGTDIKNFGFKVRYQRFEEGVYFPVACSGEFKLDVLFFLKRDFALSMTNSAFRKTNVESSVNFETLAVHD